MKKNITEWENKREEVVVLINQAKTEFSGHIAAIKSGKQYSQLPKIQVAKPPPCPKLHPMPQPIPPPVTVVAAATQQQSRISPSLQQQSQRVPPSPLPLDRKVITPPSNRIRLGGATTPQQQLLHNPIIASSNNHMNGNYVVCSSSTTTNSMSNTTNVTPNKAMTGMNLNHQHQQTMSQLHSSMPATTTIAPIGVRPPNFQNGGMVSKTAIGNCSAGLAQLHSQQQRQSPSMISSQQQNHYHQNMLSQQQHPSYIPSQQQHHHQQYIQQQQQSAALKSTLQHNNNTSYNQWSGWSDQVNNIDDLLNPHRSFGPLGSNFGDSSSSSAALGLQRNNNNNLGNIGGPTSGGNENHGAFFP